MSYFKRRYVVYRGHRQGYRSFFARTQWLWWSLVIVYFVLGFLLLGTKWYVTTHADELRERITTAISEATGARIDAQRFELDFHGLWPRLELEGLRFSRPNGSEALTIPHVRAEIAWSSLWQLELHFRNLIVHSPTLTLQRLDDRHIDLAGFVLELPSFTNESSPTSVTDELPALALLFAQNRLSLVNGTILYQDLRRPDSPPMRVEKLQGLFQNELLEWRSGLDGTIVSGHRADDFSLRFHVQKGLFNDPTRPTTWKAKGYANFDRTNVGLIARRLGLQNYVASGVGHVRIWTELNQGALTNLQADFAARNIRARLASDLKSLTLQEASGRLLYLYDPATRTQTLSAEDLRLHSSDRWQWEPKRLFLRRTTNEAGETVSLDVGASTLDIALLSTIGTSLPLSDEIRETLTAYPLSGRVWDLSASARGDLKKPDNWQTSFRFDGLTLAPANDRPSFHNLSGSVETAFSDRSIRVKLKSRNASLTFPEIFRRETMHFTKLDADATITKGNFWSVSLQKIAAENTDASVTGAGTWVLDDDVAGHVQLSGSILRANGPSVQHYLPLAVGNDTLEWLEHGILKGKVTSGDWLLEGRLADFPWADNQTGHFRIRGQVTNGVLDFLPSVDSKTKRFVEGLEWPILNEIDADLLFEGERMLITGRRAESMGLTASDVRVEIPAFSAQPVLLKVDGTIHGDARDAIRYLNQAPALSRLLGGAFAQSSGSGKVDVQLGLSIPLSTPEKTKVNVTAKLQKTHFSYGYGLPVLENADGELAVTESSVTTPTPLSGRTASGPARVAVRTEGRDVVIDVEGRVSPRELAALAPSSTFDALLPALSGTAPARVYATIDLDQKRGLRLSGRSDLSGLTSKLPAPFAKTAEETWPTSFSWAPRTSGYGFTLSSAGHVETALYFDEKGNERTLSSGFVGVGVPLGRVSDRLDVAVRLPTFDWNDWAPYWQAVDRTNERNDDNNILPWGTMRVEIGNLLFHHMPFHDIDLTVRHFGENDWHFRLASQEVNGQLELLQPAGAPPKWTAKIDRAYLPEAAGDEIDTALEQDPSPSTMPSLSLTIGDLRVGERRIGKVEFVARNEITPDGKGLAIIDRIAVTARGGSLLGQGVWHPDSIADKVGTTRVTLEANFSDLGRLLHDLRIRDVIRNAPGNVKLALTWRGQPHKPQIDTLSGDLKMLLGSGQILQIEPGSGRLLSLLSMQHLMKRLTLDFRDVIGKGFTFDSIAAGGKLHQGVLTTDKLAIVGAPATILLSGTTDLVHETLDTNVLVLPKFNAEAPALALTLLNPAIGVGTFIAQWFLKDEISNLMSSTYHISGTFRDPIVEKADKPQTNKTAPTK